MNTIEKIENDIENEKIVLNQYDKFHKYQSKAKSKTIYFVVGLLLMVLIVTLIFNTPYLLLLFGFVIFLYIFSYRILKKDIKKLEKKIKGSNSKINRLNNMLEEEKSYPRTTIIRLLAPYHSFKADVIDNKVIIKELKDKKMVIVAEKTIEEVISDFKNQIGTFNILRAQICMRIDYPGKDNFKWFELEDLLETKFQK